MTGLVFTNQTRIRLSGKRLASTPNSAIWIENCQDVEIVDCWVSDYNKNDSNGHGGICIIGDSSNVTVKCCRASKGRGNGIRVEALKGKYPSNVTVEANRVELTYGQSAEGITCSGNQVRVIGNLVDCSWVTGILVYAGTQNLANISIMGNTVSNSGQDPAPGRHSAIMLNPTSLEISDVKISNNIARNDQSDRTQVRLLTLEDNGKGGTVCRISGRENSQYWQLRPEMVGWSSTIKMIDVDVS